MAYRCDIYTDCDDSSDENNCNFLQYTYEGISEPPLANRGHKGIPVYVNMMMVKFGNFDEMSSTYKARFSLNLTWFDYRITFENLKGVTESFNYLEKEDIDTIWKPMLRFRSSVERKELAFDNLASVTVPRRGKPVLDSVENYYENEMFSGTENPFVYNSTFELLLNCIFDLRNFPFDYQICFIDVSAKKRHLRIEMVTKVFRQQ